MLTELVNVIRTFIKTWGQPMSERLEGIFADIKRIQILAML